MDDDPRVNDLGAIYWPDAKLDGVDLDYEAVTVRIREFEGRLMAVVCIGPISLRIDGFWDDTDIISASVTTDDPRIGLAVQRIGEASRFMSGSEARNSMRFSLLEIQLDGGATLECVAGSVSVSLADK